jgi:glycerophosphoryl diester phosphodiesterase
MEPRPLRSLLLALGLAFLLAMAPSCSSSTNDEPACTNIQLCRTDLVIAHRGGGALAPEETMESFRNAIAVGADVLELDVHATSDGTIVCMHDDLVDRTTDGAGRVKSFTFADLRKLDAGYRFTTDDGKTFPFRGKGVVVPTLDEILRAFPDRPFTIEIKQTNPPIGGEVVRIVEAAGMIDRVVFASFDDETLIAIRKKSPRIVTSFGGGELLAFSRLDEERAATYTPPARVLQAPAPLAEPPYLAFAERFGLRLHVWTINSREEMEALLERGVHGIMTDDPALLREVVKSRAR